MTINTIMLVALGFLVATLLAAIIAPAYRNRTMRLTAEALRRALPQSEVEIRAERDRMRAEHAIRIHNLETQLERATLNSARQKIEVNRRDARISELEGIADRQRSDLDELENARRVLEQTVTDRLPKIEGRLADARRLLQQRDTEVTTLAETAQRQARAIAEASQINAQQGVEIEQLRTALSTRAARNADAPPDSRFDSEIALRAEVEALRTKARDQASLIDRLQAIVANPASGAEPSVVEVLSNAVGAASRATLDASVAEFNRLQGEFSELKSAYALARAKVEAAEAETSGARQNEADLRKLKAEKEDLSAEVARLKAALAAYETTDPTERGVKETPIAMKAKISALEAQAKEQSTLIESLRAEVAAVNERLARQAAHYMDEMKKLGAGTVQATTGAPARTEPKRTLADRITDPRVVRLAPLGDKLNAEAIGTATAALGSEPKSVDAFDRQAQAETNEALGEAAAQLGRVLTLVETAPQPEPPADASHATPAQPSLAGMSQPAQQTPVSVAQQPATGSDAKPRRPRLLERITSIDKGE